MGNQEHIYDGFSTEEYCRSHWSLLSHIGAPTGVLTGLVIRDPSPLRYILLSVLILWVWIWYRERGLCSVCAFLPGRVRCCVHLLCWIYRWITLSRSDDVEIINTTAHRINTAQGLGACSRAFRRVTVSLYMESMFSSTVPSLLEPFNVYERCIWTTTCTILQSTNKVFLSFTFTTAFGSYMTWRSSRSQELESDLNYPQREELVKQIGGWKYRHVWTSGRRGH